MAQLTISFLLLILAATIVTTSIRSIIRAWLDYRVKLAFVRRMERGSPAISSPEAVAATLEQLNVGQEAEKRNYALTGGMLATMGLVTMVMGRVLRVGPVAVGLDLGGALAVILGLFLTCFGLLAQYLAKRRPA